VWMRSSTKRTHDAAARTEQIERASTALEVLCASLCSSRCRLATASRWRTPPER